MKYERGGSGNEEPYTDMSCEIGVRKRTPREDTPSHSSRAGAGLPLYSLLVTM